MAEPSRESKSTAIEGSLARLLQSAWNYNSIVEMELSTPQPKAVALGTKGEDKGKSELRKPSELFSQLTADLEFITNLIEETNSKLRSLFI